jgi:opacity protein-like surface antigen
MKSRVFAAVVLVVLLSSVAFAQKINTDWDRTANFSNYHTYAWEPSPHPAKNFWNDRIMEAIDKELQAKGFTKVDASANPDMWVVYSNSIKDQKQVVGTGYNMGPGWGWGYWGGPTSVTYNTYVTKQGTLVVDIADAKNKQLLWRGDATDTISDNTNKNINNLNKAVSKLFKNFPPKEKK